MGSIIYPFQEKSPEADGDVFECLASLEADMYAHLDRTDLTEEERARCLGWLARLEPLRALAAASRPASLAEIADLPPELLKELNVPSDQLETQIVAVLQGASAPVDLDQILVGLFRRFAVIQKRRFLQNKLWRMVKKQQIHKMKNRKGLYSLQPVKGRPDKPSRRDKRAG